jgi:hypothetical protein
MARRGSAVEYLHLRCRATLLDQDDALGLSGLAEVHLKGATGVPRGESAAVDGLRLVDVPELRSSRQAALRRWWRRCPRCPLAAPSRTGRLLRRTGARRTPGCRGRRGGHAAGHAPAPPGSRAGERHSRESRCRAAELVHEAVLVDERKPRQPDALCAIAYGELQDASVLGAPGLVHEGDAPRVFPSRTEPVGDQIHDIQQCGRVVVTGEHHPSGRWPPVLPAPTSPGVAPRWAYGRSRTGHRCGFP